MSYTKYLFILTLLLGGCASSPTEENVQSDPVQQTDLQATQQTAATEDISQYREAITYLNDNQLDQAENLFTGITANHPELAGPWANLGLIALKRGDYTRAKINLDKAVTRNPKLAQALNMLGYTEEKLGHITKAKDYYLQALAAKNDYALAHYNLALLYDVYFKDIPKSIEHYKEYLKYNTNSEDTKTASWVAQLEAAQARGKP